LQWGFSVDSETDDERNFIFIEEGEAREFFVANVWVEQCNAILPPRNDNEPEYYADAKVIWQIVTPEGEFLEMEVFARCEHQRFIPALLRRSRERIEKHLRGWRGERGRGCALSLALRAWEC
jgi:hypothetical protein